MRPSVITDVESTGSRLFARLIVVTVSIPSPEKNGGLRMSRHCTSGCAACLPSLYVGSHAFARDDASTALLRAVAVAVDMPGVGCTHGTSIGSDCDETTRIDVPIWRASTYEPSSVSVF